MSVVPPIFRADLQCRAGYIINILYFKEIFFNQYTVLFLTKCIGNVFLSFGLPFLPSLLLPVELEQVFVGYLYHFQQSAGQLGRVVPSRGSSSRARSLRNLLVSGNECGRVFPAGVGPGSPSRDAANSAAFAIQPVG